MLGVQKQPSSGTNSRPFQNDPADAFNMQRLRGQITCVLAVACSAATARLNRTRVPSGRLLELLYRDSDGERGPTGVLGHHPFTRRALVPLVGVLGHR